MKEEIFSPMQPYEFIAFPKLKAVWTDEWGRVLKQLPAGENFSDMKVCGSSS